jgi:hypothetical protein
MDLFHVHVGNTEFHMSRATLMRIPDTYFTRLIQKNPLERTIFVDRDPENFSHVEKYLTDGTLSFDETTGISTLRKIEREFKFYSIHLEDHQVAFVATGEHMEWYDKPTNKWYIVKTTPKYAKKGKYYLYYKRLGFSLSVLNNNFYMMGGIIQSLQTESSDDEEGDESEEEEEEVELSFVDKFNVDTGVWTRLPCSMPVPRFGHVALSVGSSIYVLGGYMTSSVTKFTPDDSESGGSWTELTMLPESDLMNSGVDTVATVVGNKIVFFGQRDVYILDTDACEQGWVLRPHLKEFRRGDMDRSYTGQKLIDDKLYFNNSGLYVHGGNIYAMCSQTMKFVEFVSFSNELIGIHLPLVLTTIVLDYVPLYTKTLASYDFEMFRRNGPRRQFAPPVLFPDTAACCFVLNDLLFTVLSKRARSVFRYDFDQNQWITDEHDDRTGSPNIVTGVHSRAVTTSMNTFQRFQYIAKSQRPGVKKSTVVGSRSHA